MKNKIIGHKDNKKAVIDQMEIALTEMALSIGSMNEAGSQVKSTCEILKPLTFAINCHRNLTFGIAKEIAEITVNAKIPTIEMNMSEQDYATIMQTLSGNLAEGKDSQEPAAIPTSAPTTEALPPSVEDEADIGEEEEEEVKVNF